MIAMDLTSTTTTTKTDTAGAVNDKELAIDPFLVEALQNPRHRLTMADGVAKKWKRKGAWRGVYFPEYNVTVVHHRAVFCLPNTNFKD